MAVLDAGIAICGKRANFFHRVIRHFIKPGTGKKKILPFYFISFKAGSPFHLPQRIGDDVLCRVAFLSFLTRNPSQGKAGGFCVFVLQYKILVKGSKICDIYCIRQPLGQFFRRNRAVRRSAIQRTGSGSVQQPESITAHKMPKRDNKTFFICPTALKNKKDGNQQHLPAFTHGVSPIILSAGRFSMVL